VGQKERQHNAKKNGVGNGVRHHGNFAQHQKNTPGSAQATATNTARSAEFQNAETSPVPPYHHALRFLRCRWMRESTPRPGANSRLMPAIALTAVHNGRTGGRSWG
jgi:hypothetical protein